MSEEVTRLKEEEKKGESNGHYAAEPEASPRSSAQHSNWGGGLALIVIGLIFLFANITDVRFDNWWAFFILIPAFSNLGQAVRNYQRNGRLTHSGRSALTGGLIISLVASVFLFNLDWGFIWPFFLIIGGMSALIGNWLN